MLGVRPLLAGALAIVALAAGGCAPPPAKPLAASEHGPTLWRVEDANTRIWLLGTVHLLPPDLEWRRPVIAQALAEADVIYLETPVDAAGAAALAKAAAERRRLPPGARLDDLLAPQERGRLARLVARLRLDAESVQGLQPWAAALQLSLAHAMVRGQDPAAGVDQAVTEAARARGTPVRYFETAAQQVALLADLPRAAQVRFLAATLRQLEEEPNAKAELDRLWLEGAQGALAARLEADFAAAGPEVRQVLLTGRNARWAADIAEILRQEEGEVLVAVGAAHFVGEDSLLRLLEAQGLDVEVQ